MGATHGQLVSHDQATCRGRWPWLGPLQGKPPTARPLQGRPIAARAANKGDRSRPARKGWPPTGVVVRGQGYCKQVRPLTGMAGACRGSTCGRRQHPQGRRSQRRPPSGTTPARKGGDYGHNTCRSYRETSTGASHA
ncbi:hypothetical protein B296_00027500 [Ensete ventricosum]|uniref:Uncharacterized protein n=1 Tax=Ensete ventricosum TaxID=4639 RepID=A0A426ZJD7_ENSVE|nr:hypothetical protein B296_00027500 [Ensete ventricosum]